MHAPLSASGGIHPTALVHETAEVGADVVSERGATGWFTRSILPDGTSRRSTPPAGPMRRTGVDRDRRFPGPGAAAAPTLGCWWMSHVTGITNSVLLGRNPTPAG